MAFIVVEILGCPLRILLVAVEIPVAVRGGHAELVHIEIHEVWPVGRYGRIFGPEKRRGNDDVASKSNVCHVFKLGKRVEG